MILPLVMAHQISLLHHQILEVEIVNSQKVRPFSQRRHSRRIQYRAVDYHNSTCRRDKRTPQLDLGQSQNTHLQVISDHAAGAEENEHGVLAIGDDSESGSAVL